MARTKERLDLATCGRYPEHPRKLIQSWIIQGKVSINGIICTKAGTMVASDDEIAIQVPNTLYVSRGGYKLAGALDAFKIDPIGLTVLDAGISTGGFTDCLLQRGAQKIYGIDVGYAQTHEKISNDRRVTLFEKTNIRTLEKLPTLVDLVVMDISFISVLKVMPNVRNLMHPHAHAILLIKPQFEGHPRDLKKGIVTSVERALEIASQVIVGLTSQGFICHGTIPSPILGTQGNTEYLAHLTIDPDFKMESP